MCAIHDGLDGVLPRHGRPLSSSLLQVIGPFYRRSDPFVGQRNQTRNVVERVAGAPKRVRNAQPALQTRYL